MQDKKDGKRDLSESDKAFFNDNLEFTKKDDNLKLTKDVEVNTRDLMDHELGIDTDEPDRLPESCDFETFSRWFSYPSYKGLHIWQKACHETTYKEKFSEILVPREHGKSILLSIEMQYALMFDNFDLLYMGWTDRRKEVAEMVYNFGVKYGLIMTDKCTSPFHFKFKNGARFDCYLITSKDVLGKHEVGDLKRYEDLTEEDFAGLDDEFRAIIETKALETKSKHRKLWLAVDDPLDISFMHERHKEESLERRFDSTLYSINPDKWSFTGTKKFQGDFFDFLEEKFGPKLKQFKFQPILPNGALLCPERYTYPGLSTYDEDRVAGKKDLYEIKADIGQYAWSSEWCQDPHPITGEVFKTFNMIDHLEPEQNYNMICIVVDRATTKGPKSDYTGIVVIGRLSQKNKRKKDDPWVFDILDDLTGKYTIVEVANLIEKHYAYYKSRYTHVQKLFIAVEKQGGGDDFYTMSHSFKYKFAEALSSENLIHTTRNKHTKIKDILKAPINNTGKHYLRIPNNLKGSELYDEITQFPYSAKVDAIDALAMGLFECMKYDDEFLSLEEIQELLIKQRPQVYSKYDLNGFPRGFGEPPSKPTANRSMF